MPKNFGIEKVVEIKLEDELYYYVLALDEPIVAFSK